MTRPQPLVSNLFPRPGRRPALAASSPPAPPTDPGVWRSLTGGAGCSMGVDPYEPEGAGEGLDGEPGCLLDAREGGL